MRVTLKHKEKEKTIIRILRPEDMSNPKHYIDPED